MAQKRARSPICIDLTKEDMVEQTPPKRARIDAPASPSPSGDEEDGDVDILYCFDTILALIKSEVRHTRWRRTHGVISPADDERLARNESLSIDLGKTRDEWAHVLAKD